MKAVVLVGGEGTRLRPLTLTTPKPLLPIACQPFLERQLTWLARHGVTEVVLSLGYLPDAFTAHFPDATYTPHDGPTLGLHYAVESTPLGTAGGIRFAAAAGGIDERFVVCNGDVLTTLDLSALLDFHAERRAEATIHLTHVDDPSAFGVVPTRDDGSVEAFVEKPAAGTAPTDWINAGTYVLEPSVLARIPTEGAVSIEHETFPSILEHDGRLFAMGTDDYWIDIGTPEKYLAVHADVLAGRVGMPPVPGASEARAGLWLQGASTIAADADVDAPVLVASGTVIGPRARVAASTVGAACTLGEDAVVEHSVLLDGAQLAPGSRVMASIIGPGALLEAGASVVDGSIIGAGAHVASGTTVAGARVALPATAG
jgi:NDP-sugar pyrophosphorylase family protein